MARTSTSPVNQAQTEGGRPRTQSTHLDLAREWVPQVRNFGPGIARTPHIRLCICKRLQSRRNAASSREARKLAQDKSAAAGAVLGRHNKKTSQPRRGGASRQPRTSVTRITPRFAGNYPAFRYAGLSHTAIRTMQYGESRAARRSHLRPSSAVSRGKTAGRPTHTGVPTE
jgi:hypothetical protein